MKSHDRPEQQRLPSDWLLLALIGLLPFMNPPVDYPMTATDLAFVLAAGALLFEVAAGRRRLRWDPAWLVLAAYAAGLMPSLLSTPDLRVSLFKLATEGYLIGLTAVTAIVAGNPLAFRRAITTWLAVTMAMVLVGVAGLLAFAAGAQQPLYQYVSFHFGTLPPGDYPRLKFTFLNANMACNYLTMSLGLTCVAWSQGWLNQRMGIAIAGTIVAAAAFTISPGLGGIALALGTGLWVLRRSRVAVLLGTAVALAFLVPVWLTPIPHSTATFALRLPGLTLEPAGRFLTGAAAWREFLGHPLVGHGIGIDAVAVRYADPSGFLQQLTDAHNLFLSLAAQTGLVGLTGLMILIGYASLLTFANRHDKAALLLGLTFLNGFVYQGLSGSFEDTRHLWVMLGLLIARVRIIRADGNNRRVGAPWSG